MATPTQPKKYLYVSLTVHLVLFLVLVLSYELTSTMPVVENTNKNDVISAVVLGDTAKSKILPQQAAPKPKPIKPVVKEPPKEVPPKVEPKIEPKVKPKAENVEVKKDVIVLKALDKKKKLAEEKAREAKKVHDLLAKDFLADLKKIKTKQKQLQQKELQSAFQKTLRETAEKSLRQQLLNEEIKLKGTESRQSQGEVNKYKALIIQAISEQWIVPTQANKKLYCELMIRLAPGGMVLDVQVTKTSGDPSLDSSARAAVLKASPLPVPPDANAFESFRQFVLKVKPENVLASTS